MMKNVPKNVETATKRLIKKGEGKLKLYGSAGTGKTYNTLNIAEMEFNNGTELDDLVYFSYTVGAAEEGLERILDRLFADIDKEYLEDNWRTVHSCCFDLLNLNVVMTATPKRRETFCSKIGVDFSLDQSQMDSSEIEGSKENVGNKLFSAYDYLRSRAIEIDDIEEDISQMFDLDTKIDTRRGRITPKEFMVLWEGYKKQEGLLDFQDMLTGVLRRGLVPDAEVMIVDEFQDMTPLQYEVFKMWEKEIDRIYIAGDEKQAIYVFGGADPDFLMEEDCDEEIYLDKTYRLSSDVWKPAKKLAHSLKKVENPDLEPKREGGEYIRYEAQPQTSSPRQNSSMIDDEEGFDSPELINHLEEAVENEKSVLALFRARFQAQEFENIIIEKGIPFDALRGFDIWTDQFTRLRDGIIEIVEEGETEKSKKRTVTNLLGKEAHSFEDIEKFIKKLKRKVGFDKKPYHRSKEEKEYPLNYYQVKAITKHLRTKQYWDVNPKTVQIGTKHSAKGMEAQVVLTSLDTCSKVAQEMYGVNGIKDDEKRVDFVALTRASEKLVVDESAWPELPNHTVEMLQS